MKVKKVATMNMSGKVKRQGRFSGRRANWKKAIITLRDGFTIDFSRVNNHGGKEF